MSSDISIHSWLRRLCMEKQLDEALKATEAMHRGGTPISVDIIYCLLQGCTEKKDLEACRQVHSYMVAYGLDSEAFLADYLIRLLASCGSLPDANQVFSKVLKPSKYTWNAIISANANLGDLERAFELYQKMQQEGIKQGKFTLLAILKACSGSGTLGEGRLIHGQVVRSGLETDMVLGTLLVDLYAKCACLDDAHKVFEELPNRNVVSWNAIVVGYAQDAKGQRALEFFEKMHQEGLKPDRVTLSSALKACGSTRAIGQGRLINEEAIRVGLESDVVVGSALVDMYVKCGSPEDASKLFDKLPNQNVVSWNVVLAGYAHHGKCVSALQLFGKMQKRDIKPDKTTWLLVLKACGRAGAIHQGKQIHEQIIKSGLETDLVIGNTLVDMYVKCNNLEEGQKLFSKLRDRDVVSWNALIAGYVEHTNALSALELFQEMQLEGIQPTKFTFSCILKACSALGAIEQGKRIHDQMTERGLEIDLVLGNTLIDMYVQCESLETAHKVLGELPDRDVLSWNALIAGYAQCGNWNLVEQCIRDMQQQDGLRPNGGTYTSILAACSNGGQVEEGCTYFNSMQDFGIKPSIEHFNCMVDLLGRTGRLKEAEELLQTMPILPDIAGWRSLLAACRTYGNVKVGRLCFDESARLDPDSSGIYVLMLNTYADACMSEHLPNIEQLKTSAQSWRKPGKAWIEVRNRVHEFVVGDKTHEVSDKIYAKLRRIRTLIEEEGYLWQTGS